MKINSNPPCPFLPAAPATANYRILRAAGATESPAFALAAQGYAQYLWTHGYPARSILALCRALYAAGEPSRNIDSPYCPYQAYLWIIQFPNPRGFLGNPRISFQHQTLRMPENSSTAKRCRANALWLLTIKARPDLTSDPNEKEPDKSIEKLLQIMLHHCGQKETSKFQKAYVASIPT